MSKLNMEDIEALEALMDEVQKIRQDSLENNTEPQFITSLKKKAVSLKFKLGIKSSNMDAELGFQEGSLDEWTMKYASKDDAIGQSYGPGARYDVPTKCRVVEMHLDHGVPIHKLADKYNVSQSAISHWRTQYKTSYHYLKHSAEGTMVIGREEKRIIGLENIKIVQNAGFKAEEIKKQIINELGKFNSDTDKVLNTSKQLEELSNSFEIKGDIYE